MKFSKQFTKFVLTFFSIMVLTVFVYSLPPHGDEGCTPGYWKNHTDMWPAGYTWDTPVFEVFEMPCDYDGNILYPELENDTLLDALKYKGGKDMLGAVRIFLRHAVAALLNIAHYDVSYYYPHDQDYFLWWANKYLEEDDREAILTKAGRYALWNEANCPLDNGK